MIKSKFLAAQFFFTVLVCAGIVWAQYPDTLWVPVTFYDFRSNGTNPEFEMDHVGGLRQGQVASTLDAERKPVLGTTPYLNYGVKNWFRKWDLLSAPIHAKGDSMKPGYDGAGVFQGFNNVHQDTFFKNIVIKDSLPFIHQGGGTYLFERDGQNNTPQFFWIDGKGFGNEGRSHNYSFTMEMHRAFVYKRGMQFQFNGDDDVWAFVDGRLAMDLGGVHSSLANTFTIDNMGLVAGQEYSFDFFYAERHTNEANIKIITNFFDNSTATTVSISEIQLDALPSIDTIFAGDSLKLTATVWLDSVDQFGAHHRLLDTIRSGAVQWYFDGDSSGGKYVSGQGPIRRNTFTATKAYKTFTLRAQIVENGQTITKIKSVYVRANIPHHLNVESIAYGQAGFNVNVPVNVTSLTMPNNVVRDTVYAVLRDIYNNYARSSASTAWVLLSADASIATAQPGNASIGEGILIKQGSAGSVQIAANNLDSASLRFRDTITVTIDPASYAELRFIAGTGGQRRVITTLTINRTRDTVLYAEARRADNVINPATGDAWWPIQTTWSLSVSPVISVQNPAPSPGLSWTFHALDTGHTTMLIRYGASLTQTLPVVVSQDGADRIVLYNINAVQYSDPSITYSWQAGVILPVAARIVDPYGLQLTQYSTAPQDANITWVVRQVLNGQLIDTGIGTLSAASGSVMNFIPKRAYTTLYVIASFNNTLLNRIDRDTIRLSINPPIVDHIVIEPTPDSTQSLNRDNPFPGNPHQIVMSNTGGALGVYGILRDRYGNFVNHADSVSWISRDTMVVTAVIGPSWQQGQGLITRQTSSNDTTWVVAAKGALTDSILIIISAVTYDSLQIYVLDNGVKNIAALSIRTDQDTTFYARGKRSDNGQWVNVPVSWWGTAALNFRPTAPMGPTWQDLQPDSIGTGRIIASCSGTTGTIADTVTVTVLPGLPSRLTLYPRDGAPTIVSGINPPLPDQSITDTIVAGMPFVMVGKMFDRNGVWLSSYEAASTLITWKVEELSGSAPTGMLRDSIYYRNSYTAQRAYNTVQVIAEYVAYGVPMRDTVTLTVVPGAARHVYIESDQNPPLNNANAVDTVRISDNETYRSVYAVIRDSLGNLIGYSTQNSWHSFDTGAVYGENGNNTIGEGKLRRNPTTVGDTVRFSIHCTYGGNNFYDTATAVVLAYHFTQLRITDGSGNPVSSVTTSTNDNTILRVQGLRSDVTVWIDVAAQWRTTPGLQISPRAPERAGSWTFSPDSAGSGYLWVTMGNDPVTAPDSIPVAFTRGALTSVEFILLTPTNQLIAGDTILAVVRIRNADGLVPGVFCFLGDNSNSVIYQDIDTASGSSPVIIVDGVDTTLNPGTSSLVTMAQCFSQGLDTVRVVLFNAATNNAHKLTVVIGSLTASTSLFSLMPGIVDSMVIETGAGLSVTSRVLNYPNDYLPLYSVLYDASGNRRGSGKSNWRTTGTLHAIENANNTVRVYYTAAEVTGDESGLIIARVVDSSNGIHEDTVSVSINGPRPVVTGAITRDMSGNGILDAIELRFSRVATIPHDYPFLDSMYSNFMDGTVLRIASITRYGGTLTTADTSLSDSVFLIHLIDGAALAQTAQTPYFDIKGLPGIIDTFLMAGDGAGPVITSVVLTINDAGPLRDMVTVTLSETIIGSDGSMFKQSTAPASVFDVWKMYTGTIDTVLASGETIHQNQIMKVDGVLDGIAAFTAVSGTSFTFRMTNGYALSADFYLSLKVDSNGFAAVMDASDSANIPVLINQKIKITQIGTRSGTGISTKRSRACGDCGTGVELSFFPAIGTGAFSFFRKRKAKKAIGKKKLFQDA